MTSLTDTSPFVGLGSPLNGPATDIECTLPDGTTVINEGDTLAPGVVCTATFDVTIPNNPALCNTAFRDRVDVELEYPGTGTPPLTAGAFATHTLLVVCRPTITVTKVADELSKVGDAVNYTITICNTGLIPVSRQSVIDSLLGNISASFDATLAPGACETESFSRIVQPGDPDPLVNTVNVTYTAGVQTATAMASDSTNLFQPAVTLDKSADVSTAEVGDTINYTIVVSNTGSADSPACVGNVVDVLLGINQAVSLAAGASTTITDSHTVLATDPDPLVNTATLTCSPAGFPNVLSRADTVTVDIVRKGGEGCTPGFWKQDHHFDSWVGFAPDGLLRGRVRRRRAG